MPRYLVTTHREVRGSAMSALAAVKAEPDVTVVSAENPESVMIEAGADTADRLRSKLVATHYVEPEIRRSLT